FWPLRAVAELREERRRLQEERTKLLEDMRSAAGEVTRAARELRATADDAVQRIQRILPAGAERRSDGECLCIELLEYWKLNENWQKNAIIAFETLADAGKGRLAQWGAKELLSGKEIELGSGRYGARRRLEQLAKDGTVLRKPGGGRP